MLGKTILSSKKYTLHVLYEEEEISSIKSYRKWMKHHFQRS